MAPRIRETVGQPPGGQSERSHLSVNDELHNTLQRLSAILDTLQSCNCPADCSGPDAVHLPRDPSNSSEHPRTPSPRRPARCREVKKRSEARSRAQVLAEAEGTLAIQLPRLGNDETGTLRMSVQVHNDPDDGARRGYYAELYLERPGQEEEEFIGYIESWLILKPTAQVGPPTRSNDWINLLQQRNEFPGTTEDTARALQALYEEGGAVQPSISFRDTSEHAHRMAGIARIDDDLGPRGTEILYIPCFWIDFEYSGNGIGPLALKMFYRLLMGGTLGRHNIGGRVTFTLTPGLLADDDMCTLWHQKVPRGENESEAAYNKKLARASVLALARFYKAQGYRIYKGEVMGRSVDPMTADPGDHLLERPNPPPLAAGGSTPSSRISRDESGSIGVEEDELEELERSGDFIPL